jgi:prepilin-type N-terminal cleavage/methylation domain-containing protein
MKKVIPWLKRVRKAHNANAGFSLVEVIVAVMILSVLGGVAGYGLSMSNGKPAEECARKLSSALSHARTSTMGKYRNTIKVSDTGSGIVVNEHIVITIDETDGTEDRTSDRSSTVGAKNVKVEYSTDNGTSYNDLSTLNIRFDSGSGKLNEVSVPNGSDNVKLTVNGRLIFRISKAGTVRYVTVMALTGKIEVTSAI